MSLSQEWRRFTFFEKEEIKNNEDESPVEKLKEVIPTCSSNGKGWLAIGDNDGFIYLVDSEFDITSFKAFSRGCAHLHQLKSLNILLSIGQDEEKDDWMLKVWNLNKVDKAGIPYCCKKMYLLDNHNAPSKITCVAGDDSGNQTVVGFESGCVLLLSGDVSKERQSKGKYVYIGDHKITGVSLEHKVNDNVTQMFISTTHEVIRLDLSKKKKIVLSEAGCSEKCSILNNYKQRSQFVVARSNAVYFFENDNLGACLAFEGEKLQIDWFKGYLIIISSDHTSVNQKTSAASLSEHQHKEMQIITIYDIENRFIAFSHPFHKIINLFIEWGSLIVLTCDFKLFRLREKDIQYKLDILFKKNLYNDAINLARQHDEEGLSGIYKQYGDHLYNKGDFDGSMQQYIKTIGQLEPSYVIRKFLDASRIENLTSYLENLHNTTKQADQCTNMEYPSEEHTTLLLNCFTKLKDQQKLNDFIMSDKHHLDADTSIRLCRSAGYFSQALHIANKHQLHEWWLRIQMEDVKDYEAVLHRISSLPSRDAENYLGRHGRELVKHLPQQSTSHIMKMCSKHLDEDGREVDGVRAEVVMDVFVDQPMQMVAFLSHVIETEDKVSPKVYNSLLELLLHTYANEDDPEKKKLKGQEILTFLKNNKMAYEVSEALVLCQLNNFEEGLLYLYEKNECFQDILKTHMHNNHYSNITDTCNKHGIKDSSLWIEALKYFTGRYKKQDSPLTPQGTPSSDEACLQHLSKILKHIDKNNLLPPLVTVQILSTNDKMTLQVAKEFVLGVIRKEKGEIEGNEEMVHKSTERCDAMRREITAANTQARIMQNQKCSVCGLLLDLPCLHAYCNHSFHQHCFDSYSENSNECPICSPENKKVLDSFRQLESERILNDNFNRQLNIASNTSNKATLAGFNVIADYFSKGLFNKHSRDAK